jgi:hypothetical protein
MSVPHGRVRKAFSFGPVGLRLNGAAAALRRLRIALAMPCAAGYICATPRE